MDAMERQLWRVLFTIYISVVDTCPEDFVGPILGDWTRNVSVLGGIGMGPPSGEKGALAMLEMPDGNKCQFGMTTERNDSIANLHWLRLRWAMIHRQRQPTLRSLEYAVEAY